MSGIDSGNTNSTTTLLVPGEDGRSIQAINIVGNHLILTFTDGVNYDAGFIQGSLPSSGVHLSHAVDDQSLISTLNSVVDVLLDLGFVASLQSLPTVSSVPVITGTAQVGNILTASAGTWSNSPTSYVYQWKRDGTAIDGATASTYILVNADIGHAIAISVTASNTAGSNIANSISTSVVIAAPVPINTILPVITGDTTDGQTLTITSGTWLNSPISYTYVWKRGGTVISGAVASTYTLTSSDIGYNITATVTATNTNGSASVSSNATIVIVAPPIPTNTIAPLISGDAQVGSVLTTTNGTWLNAPISYTYQWKRDGVVINGAASASYTVVTDDIGHIITVMVTAANGDGSAIVTSNSTSSVIAALLAPVNTIIPTISGPPQVGQTLTGTNGTWTNSPTSYTYQWKRDGTVITGATTPSYTLTSNDLTYTLTVTVTAVNSAGSVSVTSVATPTITVATIPVNVRAPKIVGSTVVGQTLTASSGTWSASPTGYTYQWRSDGNAITGATNANYTTQPADVGHTLTCAVIATNGSGSGTPNISAATASIASVLTLSANADDGLVHLGDLTVNNGVDFGPFNTNSPANQVSFTHVSNEVSNLYFVLGGNATASTGIVVNLNGPQNWNGTSNNGSYQVSTAENYFSSFRDLRLPAVQVGDEITFALGADKVIRLYINQQQVLTDFTSQLGSPNGDNGATYLGNYLGSDTSYVKIHADQYQGPILKNVKYGPISMPVNIVANSTTADIRPQMVLKYVNPDGVAPTGYEFQYETLDHTTVLRPWHDAVITANPSAGNATLEGPYPLPEAYVGGQVSVRVRQKNKTSSSSIVTFSYPSDKIFGMNLEDSTYFSQYDSPFCDWFRRINWNISGGVYNGLGANDGVKAVQKLYADGFCDKNGFLTKLPTDCTLLRLGTVDFPSSFEAGDRLLVAPAGNVLSIVFPGVSGTPGVTFNTAHPQHNPSIGHWVVNFDTASMPLDGGSHWLIQFEVSSFVPGPVSFRKVGDTSNKILTDQYVAALQRFQSLRLMDMVNANNGGTWNVPFDKRVDWGFSLEAMVELINRTLAIPYFSFGFNTTPEVAAASMQFIEQRVDPLVPYFLGDPSNEVWGGIASLTSLFTRRGIMNGRATNNGYGTPIDPSHFFIPPGVPGELETYKGGPLGLTLGAGEYVLQGVGGFTNDTLWRTKRPITSSAAVPVAHPDGHLHDNDDFEVIAENCSVAGQYEYGVFGYNLQKAITAVSPRFKMLVNLQCGDSLTTGSFGGNTLNYALTQGGTDTFGSIVDGIAIAPYCVFSDHDALNNAAQGSARVQQFANQFTAYQPLTATFVKDTYQNINNYFAQHNRNKAPLVVVYECGMEGTGFSNPPTGLIADMNTYFNTAAVQQLQDYYDGLFAAGASVVCAFTFGPARLLGLNSIPYGFFSHFESVDDTSSGRARADIATAAKYKALAASSL